MNRWQIGVPATGHGTVSQIYVRTHVFMNITLSTDDIPSSDQILAYDEHSLPRYKDRHLACW